MPRGLVFTEKEQNNFIEELNNSANYSGEKVLRFSANNKEYLFVVGENQTTGWKVVQFEPSDVLRKYIIDSIRFYLITMTALFVIAVFVGYFLSIDIVRAINKLHHGMRQVENGQFGTITGEENRKDEIGQLIKSFNHMSVRLKESIHKEYIAKMKQKKIEIKMLQAQINPHFLYNTLDLMSSIAELENVGKISMIANSLADMFRYNIKEKDIVKVKDEVKQIQDYIRIQKLRFPKKYVIIYDIEDRLYECRVLKFLLQPIVENAILHGVEKKKDSGTIKIIVKEVNESLTIKIEDNGIGMDNKVVEEINRKLRSYSEEAFKNNQQQNLGLLNVHNRIRDYYGPQYGLTIYSQPDEGTSVEIILPIIMKEGEAE